MPLGGQPPLALYQQQTKQGIEDPARYNPLLPTGTVEVLRWLTAEDPAERASDAAEPMRKLLGLLDVSPIEITSSTAASEAHHNNGSEPVLPGPATDANDLLVNALKTWTPGKGQSPFTRTQFVLISSARGGDTPLPAFQLSLANQIMLYGAFYYQREAGIDYWWKRTSDEHRYEVCFALILLTATALDVTMIERVLQFLLTFPAHKLLPADVRERLIGLVESGNSRISALALDLLVKSSGAVPKEWRYDETSLDRLLIRSIHSNSLLAPAARQAIIDTRSGVALTEISSMPGQGRRILADAWFAARSLPVGISPWLYIRSPAKSRHPSAIGTSSGAARRLRGAIACMQYGVGGVYLCHASRVYFADRLSRFQFARPGPILWCTDGPGGGGRTHYCRATQYLADRVAGSGCIRDWWADHERRVRKLSLAILSTSPG